MPDEQHRAPTPYPGSGLDAAVVPTFTAEPGVMPSNRLPEHELAPELAHQLIHDELMLDGNARLNLATFVTTWMEPHAAALMAACADKNMIDRDEYPRTAELERRCSRMLADLWHASDPLTAPGCSTAGSSEACMLAGLALKRRWAARLGGAASGRRPNVVMGADVQVCWDKFANYFEVEPRIVPMRGERHNLDAEQAAAHVDEDTLGVVAVLGSTFDGSYEPVADICAALDDVAARGGPDVPVHVDGASGAMIAPFLDLDLVWDFRLPRVASINTSGHKYGLVYPGLGWVAWRDTAALPEELVYRVNYLGDEVATFTLNFSRPGAPVAAQYYQFLRLGRDGYTRVQQHCRDVATRLADEVAALGPFRLLTRGDELPVFAATLDPQVTHFSVFDVSAGLREHGWQVPAYTFPPECDDLAVLRFVVRNGLTHSLADQLLADLRRVLTRLDRQQHPMRDPRTDSAFSHTGAPSPG
ncbi:MAG TPA: glutamate decarboxylase [Actinomycetospora sp.]|jgi:glutamate decarboxylase|uniref:glutamate decarboxylase n=1 Tax=Actinomycetospora sp. TaxID=1872135 RepID=UPI002F42F99B